MIKDDCGGVWLDWPHVITLFDDDGNERDYLPERTCRYKYVLRERNAPWECSECDYAAYMPWPRYCPGCGARVVYLDE